MAMKTRWLPLAAVLVPSALVVPVPVSDAPGASAQVGMGASSHTALMFFVATPSLKNCDLSTL